MPRELEIITRAQLHLENQPIDMAHDVEHHRRVVKNCIKIIQAEHLKVNQANVIMAAWWHDVESQEGETNLLQKEMESIGFNEDTIAAVSAIVQGHTFGERQETVEAKILFDADKLEYFNPERMRKALRDAQKGLLPVPILRKHHEAWLQRHQTVLKSFNFKFSKKTALQNLPKTQAEIKKMGFFLNSRKHPF